MSAIICFGLLLLASAASQLEGARDSAKLVFPLEGTSSTPDSALTHEQLAAALEELELDGELRGRELGQKVAELLARTTDKKKRKAVFNEFSVEQLLELNSFEIVQEVEGEKPDTFCERDELENRKRVCERFERRRGGWVLANYCRICVADFVEACRQNIDRLFMEVVLKGMEERDVQRMSAFSREVSELAARTGAKGLSSAQDEDKVAEALKGKAPFYRKLLRKNCSSLLAQLHGTIFAFEESIWMVLAALGRSAKLDKERHLKLIGRCQTVERLGDSM